MNEFDYRVNKLKTEGGEYDLDDLRRWLLRNHEQLVMNNFIKTINTHSGTKSTFDWQYIFFLADTYGYITNFINEQK